MPFKKIFYVATNFNFKESTEKMNFTICPRQVFGHGVYTKSWDSGIKHMHWQENKVRLLILLGKG